MKNGSNSWNVAFSKITWFQSLLEAHDNVSSITREKDIYFRVTRMNPSDTLRILALSEYTAGLETVLKALGEFQPLNMIHVGGGWCGYTQEAKEYCLKKKLGLYLTDEMTGALWRREYWSYHKRDKKGNPIYCFRAA